MRVDGVGSGRGRRMRRRLADGWQGLAQAENINGWKRLEKVLKGCIRLPEVRYRSVKANNGWQMLWKTGKGWQVLAEVGKGCQRLKRTRVI